MQNLNDIISKIIVEHNNYVCETNKRFDNLINLSFWVACINIFIFFLSLLPLIIK